MIQSVNSLNTANLYEKIGCLIFPIKLWIVDPLNIRSPIIFSQNGKQFQNLVGVIFIGFDLILLLFLFSAGADFIVSHQIYAEIVARK